MIRVLVVDDSAVLRRLITTVLAADPDIEVVGTAVDGLEAIEKVDELAPDAVTLDVEMPRLDGIGAVEVIHRNHPRLPVVMFSTLTERGAAATLQALSNGASDYVAKPTGAGNVGESMARVREDLVPRLKALVGARRMVAAVPVVRRAAPRAAAPPQVLVVACSTGGPDALSRVLAALPAAFPLPVLVTQHMPPVFTTQFAQRLDRVSPLEVREAADGDQPRPGLVLIAPGDHHLTLVRRGASVRAQLDQGPRENFCRPAADPLFRSAAGVHGPGVLGLVLTGMGQDALEGARAVVDAGGRVVVQDEATSVVWGMPGAVAGAALAHEVLPLDRIAGALTGLAGRALTPAP
ncbi:protein-glutamate methylesterase/protein-glutamine glutaminase [Nocardioides kribbensis]|uniref:protein-glutamate methylesterase/protein-glutamine glutaminase n=1 Tax=Nocardioides kribbensis TaxID=305517 RepID=UPI0032DAEA4A